LKTLPKHILYVRIRTWSEFEAHYRLVPALPYLLTDQFGQLCVGIVIIFALDFGVASQAYQRCGPSNPCRCTSDMHCRGEFRGQERIVCPRN
jgi:hypothetical protein